MKQLTYIGAILITVLSCCEVTFACVCGGYPTVCSAYANADAVFIGSVERIDTPTPKKTSSGADYVGGQLAHIQVETVFKGPKLLTVDFLTEGSSCDATYKVGQRWLFYSYFDKRTKQWGINACDRSTRIDNPADAAEDLLYLRALPSAQEKTRFSGSLRHYEDDPVKGFSVSEYLMGVKVKIVGAKQTYEAYTDRNGVFEVYDLPPGKYSVMPDIPRGLKVRFPMLYGEVDRSTLTKDPLVVLKEKSCASVGFVFSSNTSISGTLFGADGQVLPNVCLNLTPKDMANKKNWLFDCTDKDGKYEVKDIPPGDYVMIVNFYGEISSNAPFPLAYYPGVFEKEKATVLTISAGDNLSDYDIHIPTQESTRILKGVLLYEDGTPVAKAFVEFKADSVRPGYSGEVHTSTDKQGRFTLNVLEGLKGSLRGFMYAYQGEYANCPKLDELLKQKNVSDVGTKAIKLEINSDLEDIKLVFPFPACAKVDPN
ncbi:MAG TPA: carboxypeptidase-like regulatory domain-containing protein [Pyrinomonadaceae bacterium]|nr:carboxypeptidase-like regulatory domain-containing protein [Pyrinomonadaceae bacterium]